VELVLQLAHQIIQHSLPNQLVQPFTSVEQAVRLPKVEVAQVHHRLEMVELVLLDMVVRADRHLELVQAVRLVRPTLTVATEIQISKVAVAAVVLSTTVVEWADPLVVLEGLDTQLHL
jgi:hypothetical protein